MKITTTKNDNKLLVALEGRLDTATAPELEQAVVPLVKGVEELTLDFAALDYVSSAGLRVLLMIHRRLSVGGRTRVINANQIVKEVFSVTGFNDILDIE